MPSIDPDLIVVTDLDGTLLGHEDYRSDAALPAVRRILDGGGHIVLCSSKTVAEIVVLQEALGLVGEAAIAENGAIVLPGARDAADAAAASDAHRTAAEAGRDRLREAVRRLRRELGLPFDTFSEADDRTVAAWTGLDLAAAHAARDRRASEVLRWTGPPGSDTPDRTADLLRALAAEGLGLVRGGRFWHVLPADRDKGTAVREVVAAHRRRTGRTPTTIGLGDGPNDVPLLDAVDLAVVVRGLGPPPGPLADDRPDRVHRTIATAPAGWAEGIDHHLRSSR